jgi:hypothetical protein
MNYHYILHNNPEQGISHFLRGGNLKSRTEIVERFTQKKEALHSFETGQLAQ